MTRVFNPELLAVREHIDESAVKTIHLNHFYSYSVCHYKWILE